MKVKITPKLLYGKITAPPSKSFAHRYLIASFLSGKRVEVLNAGSSKDVLATLNALKALGAEISNDNNKIVIEKKAIIGDQVRTVDCFESGSTLRFLLPVASALGIKSDFTGSERLLERPIKSLVDCLNQNGANVEGFSVRGKLKGGEYNIDASVSSQYITGLLFALPLLDGDSKIILQNQSVSVGYIDVTLEVLKQFGIEIEKTDYGFYVRGNQKYIPPKKIIVEGDYSGSAFYLCAGAIGDRITIKGLNPNSCQGDREILKILKTFGAKVKTGKNKITVEKEKLRAIEYDCTDIPDLVQIISVVCAFCSGTSVLKNVQRLKDKESDRIQAILNMLKIAKIKAEYLNGDLKITGRIPIGGDFDGGNDHRTVMSSAILASHSIGTSTINGAQVTDKSYPEFFAHFTQLGGIIDVLN